MTFIHTIAVNLNKKHESKIAFRFIKIYSN